MPRARITGTLHGLWPSGHLCASYSRIGRRFEFAHFVRHVVLGCALARDPRQGYPARSLVVARPADPHSDRDYTRVELAPLRDPERVLDDLLAVVREARRRPLPFVYEPARDFAEACARAKPNGDDADQRNTALRKARKEFDDGFSGKQDAYVKLVYPTFDALREERGPFGFDALSERLLSPFFACRSVT